MKKRVKIALVSGNLGMALMACVCVSGGTSVPAMFAALAWLGVAAWLCRKYSHLISDES